MEQNSAKKDSLNKHLILIAEDDSFNAKGYEIKLLEAGYIVEVVSSGIRVIDTARAKKPDLIILDLIMPGKDGFEILKELKKDPDLQKIKVIVISNLSQSEDIKRVKDLGADDYMTKTNISLHEVCKKVQLLLH